ncbi:SICA antigen [Plasmodium coatneyi]|uniref:SICA antigen n=1 Tax=Plasmodium coatneyi TaxID=208452 RepID=A0A1B1E8C3_9APIC|nr:SICA antigen [Plasmodium coatneyi]ANQ11190.1 SICA antigen [Plasmodium coatneyi]
MNGFVWDLAFRVYVFSLGVPGFRYFFLRKKRRRHRREEQLTSPPSEEKLLDHVDDQADGPHAYTLVKERRQQRSTPQRGRKKRAHSRAGGVRRRTIIDIHLEVLDEYQKGDLHSTKEDFLQIIVHEFMGRNFVKGENVPKEQVPLINIPEEQVQCLDSGFRDEDFVPKGNVPMEQVPCSDSGFREEDFLLKEGVPKEQVQCSDSGFTV